MTDQVQAWNGRGKLQDLVKELDRQKASRLDIVADGRKLIVGEVYGKGALRLMPADVATREWLPEAGMPLKAQALEQLGQRMDPAVPIKFMRDLAEKRTTRAADLLTGLMHDTTGAHFIRTMDGQVRAVLSNRYRVLDHFDLAFTALNVARECGGEVIECALSDRRMCIKFSTRSVFETLAEDRPLDHRVREVGGQGNQELLGRLGINPGALPGGGGGGEVLSPMVTITNSETGHGGLSVNTGILRWACVNGAKMEDVVARVHLGETMGEGVWSEKTQAIDSQAIMAKCSDAIRAAFAPQVFRTLIERARLAQAKSIPNPVEAVTNVVRDHGLTDGDRDAILAHFIRDYGATQYGLAQATARYAQDVDTDKAGELESLAGRLMTV